MNDMIFNVVASVVVVFVLYLHVVTLRAFPHRNYSDEELRSGYVLMSIGIMICLALVWFIGQRIWLALT
jgi:hypothetical protein